MHCNIYLLNGVPNRRRLWNAHVESARIAMQRATVRVKPMVNGQKNIRNSQKNSEITDILHSPQPPKVGVCLRCGRKLKDVDSIARGYGDVCYKKIKALAPNVLF